MVRMNAKQQAEFLKLNPKEQREWLAKGRPDAAPVQVKDGRVVWRPMLRGVEIGDGEFRTAEAAKEEAREVKSRWWAGIISPDELRQPATR